MTTSRDQPAAPGPPALPDAPGPPAALLWDMDGTLVDTEPLWLAAETALVQAHGGSWSVADGLALVGSSLLRSGRIIVERTGIPLSPEEVVEHLVGEVAAGVRRDPPFRPGARELLAEATAAGVPCALVTMSYRFLADVVVAALPAGTFAATVTGDEVARPKPDPEPYLAAARLLGVDPRACVAIEDSPAGLASAVAAGCRVVAAPLHVSLDGGPGVVVEPDLRRLDLARLTAWPSGDGGAGAGSAGAGGGARDRPAGRPSVPSVPGVSPGE